MAKNYTKENLIFGVLVVAAAWWYFSPTKATIEPAARALAEQREDMLCKQSLDCFASKYQGRAGTDCRGPVERLAKNSFEWTTGALDARFPRAKWLDQSASTVTYVGDTIKFQNGFGAWIIHTVECDYDPQARVVLGVRANAGQL